MSQPEASGNGVGRSSRGRMAGVQKMAGLQRILFEVEREFVRTATAMICRVGSIDLKYLLCQHIWESAGHARFLRERGRELSGFGTGDQVRNRIRILFEETIRGDNVEQVLTAFYRVIKPAILTGYLDYLKLTHHLADWPSRSLVEEFIQDEERHAREMRPYLEKIPPNAWDEHIEAALASIGGWFGQGTQTPPTGTFEWRQEQEPYEHPATCNRGEHPVCSSVFSEDPGQTPIVRQWLEEPETDAKVIRLMVYVWLMMELDAVDYLATVFYDTPNAPFDLHFDLARHLWDESRHSQFGYRQLPKLGVDLATLEHSLDLYNILVQMSPPERYAMMTMEFEAGSFPTKARVMDRVRELNDFEADTLLAFDRNDEQNHVRYGHRWLPVIMEMFGLDVPVDRFIEQTRERFAELSGQYGGKTPHSLPADLRLTGEKLLHIAKAG